MVDTPPSLTSTLGSSSSTLFLPSRVTGSPSKRRKYNGQRPLEGTPNSLRLPRRFDALARLFQFKGEPVVAVAFDYKTGQFIFGFNSPKQGSVQEATLRLTALVAERMNLLRKFFFSKNHQEEIDEIWPLISQLALSSRQTEKIPYEYSVQDILIDLSKVRDAFVFPTDGRSVDNDDDDEEEDDDAKMKSFIRDNKNYILKMIENDLKTEIDCKEKAEEIYEKILRDSTYRRESPYFKEDSLDKIYFDKALGDAFQKEGNFKVMIEPKVEEKGFPDGIIHGEVAVANYFLNSPSFREQHADKIIGVSILCCADCCNLLHYVNDITKKANADESKEMGTIFPKFILTGTNAYHFQGWIGVLPSSLTKHQPMLNILRKEGLNEALEKSVSEGARITIRPNHIKNPMVIGDFCQNHTTSPQGYFLGASVTEADSPDRAGGNNGRKNNDEITQCQERLNAIRVKIRESVEIVSEIKAGNKNRLECMISYISQYINDLNNLIDQNADQKLKNPVTSNQICDALKAHQCYLPDNIHVEMNKLFIKLQSRGLEYTLRLKNPFDSFHEKTKNLSELYNSVHVTMKNEEEKIKLYREEEQKEMQKLHDHVTMKVEPSFPAPTAIGLGFPPLMVRRPWDNSNQLLEDGLEEENTSLSTMPPVLNKRTFLSSSK